MDDYKICAKCKKDKPITEFYTSNSKKRGKTIIHSYCKVCDHESTRTWQVAHRDQYLKIMKDYRQNSRSEAIRHYGGKCECCGETRSEFLTFDHINGGGHAHRKLINQMAIGIWLKNHNYPEGFRVLCYNCHISISSMGYCPHSIAIESI